MRAQISKKNKARSKLAASFMVQVGSALLFRLTDPAQDPAAHPNAKLHERHRLPDGKPELGAARQHPDRPFGGSVRRGIPLSFQKIPAKARQKPLQSAFGFLCRARPL